MSAIFSKSKPGPSLRCSEFCSQMLDTPKLCKIYLELLYFLLGVIQFKEKLVFRILWSQVPDDTSLNIC